jgi:hypothetical protein
MKEERKRRKGAREERARNEGTPRENDDKVKGRGKP